MKTFLLFSFATLAGSALLPATVHAAPPAGSAVLAATPRCAASVEAAARGIVGGTASADTQTGYRVQDITVDPILRRAYVRVADCHDPRKPLTMVQLQASLAGPQSIPSTASSEPETAHTEPVPTPRQSPPAAPILIARGDAVDILVQSSSVRMTLHGHAAESAASGGSIDVILDRQAGNTEPPHHLLGIAAAAHRVEVSR